MTDVEKTLEMLNHMANTCKADRIKQIDNASMATKEMFDSYVRVGFTQTQALELTKTFLAATLVRTPTR